MYWYTTLEVDKGKTIRLLSSETKSTVTRACVRACSVERTVPDARHLAT